MENLSNALYTDKRSSSTPATLIWAFPSGWGGPVEIGSSGFGAFCEAFCALVLVEDIVGCPVGRRRRMTSRVCHHAEHAELNGTRTRSRLWRAFEVWCTPFEGDGPKISTDALVSCGAGAEGLKRFRLAHVVDVDVVVECSKVDQCMKESAVGCCRVCVSKILTGNQVDSLAYLCLET